MLRFLKCIIKPNNHDRCVCSLVDSVICTGMTMDVLKGERGPDFCAMPTDKIHTSYLL